MSVRNVSVDAILAGTVTNYDVASPQISIAPERAKAVSFSSTYFEPNQAVIMTAGSSMTTLAEAKKARWGVRAATPAIGGGNNIHTVAYSWDSRAR